MTSSGIKKQWFLIGGGIVLAAVLIFLAVCCAALIYAQALTDSSVAYAEEHITILPTTDLSEAGQ